MAEKKSKAEEVGGAIGASALGIIWLALIVLMIGALAQVLGVLPRGWRAPTPEQMAYLAAAFWLMRKASS